MGKRFTCLGFVGAMFLVAGIVQSSVFAADTIKREAETADTISAPMKVYEDASASMGKYIGTDEGIGDSTGNPPATGIATYDFTAKGGVYKILLRVSISNGSNSFWLRIPDATKYTPGTHASGWIRFNDIDDGAAWHWDEVHSSDHNNGVVNITLSAGKHTLEIAYREDGAKLDGFVITDNLTLSQTSLPDVIDPGPKAWSPTPTDGEEGVLLPMLSWKAGTGAVRHNVYVGTTPELTDADLVLTKWAKLVYIMPEMKIGMTYYWRVDEIESDMTTIHTGNVWSFTVAPATAYFPVPPNGAKYQDLDVDLAWTGGQEAVSHEVYFSANKDDVVNGAASAYKGKTDSLTLELPPLALATTYYWRVDETNLADGKVVGPVWSFSTTVPGLGFAKRELWLNIGGGTNVADLTSNAAYPYSPSDVNDKMPNFEANPNQDNYGGRLSAWLHVPVPGKYTFWIASDDSGQLFLGSDQDSAVLIASVSGYTNSQEWDKYASQKSQPITLAAGRYYLMALWKEGGGGDHCAAAWQGAGIPNRELISGGYLMPEALWAYGSRPLNGAIDVSRDPQLHWLAGKKATGHQVYFGEDEQAVATATPASTLYRGQQALDKTSFEPGTLEFGKTYYWRVDEINPAEAGSPWVGDVWKFTTANFLVVDDFESYSDEDVGRIFQSWIDGIGYTTPEPGNRGNGTGSAVGNADPPFAERTIVKSGKQSMPLGYDNTGTPNYSETERTFAATQDWTANGMNTLSLQVRGYPAVTSVAVTETGGKMSLTGAGTDLWGSSDQFTYAYKTLNGDATIIARVDSNGVGTNRWAKGGVMIRQSLDGNSAHAMMVITGGDGNGGAFQNRASAGLDQAANDAASSTTVTTRIAPPYWVKLERVGNAVTASISANGTNWTMVGTHDVVMNDPVYIGLCVTSHQAGERRTYQFSSIQTTGKVAGAWQGAEITSPRHNTPQDFYVAVQDGAKKIAVVNNATVVNATAWTEVQIPLSSFTGVDMTKVTKMFIGVGNRANPVAGGTGMLYIDDIRVVKPAPGQ